MGFEALSKNQVMNINGGNLVVLATGVIVVAVVATAYALEKYSD